MTTERPKDTCARYKIEFGERLGPALYAFMSRLFELHRRWRDYDFLYNSDEHINALNKFAPSFFGRHQQMTFECVTMALARLTDSVRTGSSENLSLAYLVSLLEPAVKAKLQPLADDAKVKAEFARKWRNKRFAHHDLQDAVNQSVIIDPVTHMQIDNAIVALNIFAEQVHLVCGGYNACTLDYAYRSDDFGGASVLLGRVRKANEARDERQPR